MKYGEEKKIRFGNVKGMSAITEVIKITWDQYLDVVTETDNLLELYKPREIARWESGYEKKIF